MNDPGSVLRRLRVLRGMKQNHLAELMGVTQATISRWERGVLPLSQAQRQALLRLLARPLLSSQDAYLKRLVESSSLKVHLICDRTHALLAASASRQSEWRIHMTDLLGTPMITYASEEILAAEARLSDRGWHDGELSSLIVSTGQNAHVDVPIRPSSALWERLLLSNGTAARLVTTLT